MARIVIRRGPLIYPVRVTQSTPVSHHLVLRALLTHAASGLVVQTADLAFQGFKDGKAHFDSYAFQPVLETGSYYTQLIFVAAPFALQIGKTNSHLLHVGDIFKVNPTVFTQNFEALRV